MKLGQMVQKKLAQWHVEALLFCAQHGKAGGEFNVSKWANGQMMAEVPGGRANQAIPLAALQRMQANGWKIYC